jgi:hypothetical protein
MVAWGAPPVKGGGVEEPEGFTDGSAEVAPATPEETLEARDEIADAAAEEADAAALEAEAAALEAAEAAAEVALATAEDALGISMGTPASWQVFWTAAIVAAWSLAGQAPRTQGCTVERRLAPFWQWHLKSVRDEQPSVERGVMKQLNYSMLESIIGHDSR